MNKPSSKKTIVIVVVVIILGVLAYFYFSGKPTDTSSLLTGSVSATGESDIAAANVLILLNQISALKIEPAIFLNPVYMSLVDHTVIVPEQSVGKADPFAI